MKKHLLILSLFSSLVFGSSLQKNDIDLMAQVLLNQQVEIEKLKSEVEFLKSVLNLSEKKVSFEHKVINVKEWANYRKRPWGKIIKELPLGSKINIEECNIYSKGLTWCKSPDLGGGYISSKLVSWDKKE
jgi:hypothetical protein